MHINMTKQYIHYFVSFVLYVYLIPVYNLVKKGVLFVST